MNDQTRYASIRDYLGLLRRQRWLVIGITLAFVLASLLLSLSKSPTYAAEASVSFRDLSQDLRIFGVNTLPEESPQQRAAIRAENVSKLSVARKVRDRLELEGFSPEQLQAAIAARVSVETNLVLVEANWSTPEFAAELANGFAREAVVEEERRTESQLDAAIKDLESRFSEKDLRTDQPTTLKNATAQQQLVQLQAARDVARPAEVTRIAQEPTTPISPRPVRNGVLAGFVGIAFGLIAAFLRDSLDRRIRGTKDAHDELGFPILGRVGLSAMGTTGLAVNGRALPSPADLESFRMLRTNLAFFDSENPLRTVLVTSGLPQEGKSTVAAALASAAAAAGQQTLLVDCDLRRPMLASRLGLHAAPGLAEYLIGGAGPQDILQRKTVAAARNGGSSVGNEMVVISAGRPPENPAEVLTSPRLPAFLDKVSRVYELVVIDSSPLLSSVDPLEVIPYVDGIVVCVRVGTSTREEVRAVRGALGRLPDRPTGLVVTGLGVDQEEYGYYGYTPAES